MHSENRSSSIEMEIRRRIDCRQGRIPDDSRLEQQRRGTNRESVEHSSMSLDDEPSSVNEVADEDTTSMLFAVPVQPSRVKVSQCG